MNKLISLLIVCGLFAAAPALADTPNDVVKEVGPGWVNFVVTGTTSLPAADIDTVEFKLSEDVWGIVDDADGDDLKIGARCLIGNGATASADSLNVGVDVGLSESGPWVQVVAVGNDGWALNGAEVKSAALSTFGPYVRLRIKNVNAAAKSPVFKIAFATD